MASISPRNSRSNSLQRSPPQSPPRSRRRSISRSKSPIRMRSRSPPPQPQYRPRNPRQDQLIVEPSNVLGAFGLSLYTKEEDLRPMFEEYGQIEKILIIVDARTHQSRGFAFITYDSIGSASKAKEALNGRELNDRKIRVDFSISKGGHPSTPGQYLGTRRPSPPPRRYSPEPSYRRGRYSPEPYQSRRSRYSPEPIDRRRFSPDRAPRRRYSPDPGPGRGRYSPPPIMDRRRYSPEPGTRRRYSRSPSPRRR